MSLRVVKELDAVPFVKALLKEVGVLKVVHGSGGGHLLLELVDKAPQARESQLWRRKFALQSSTCQTAAPAFKCDGYGVSFC